MSDLKLTTTHDLDLTGNQLALEQDRAASIAQHVKIRLQFFLNEWFLDRNLGIPYFERILVKNPDLTTISNIFQEAILETAGILSLATFDMQFNTTTRTLTVTFKAVLQDSTELLDFSNEINISEIL